MLPVPEELGMPLADHLVLVELVVRRNLVHLGDVVHQTAVHSPVHPEVLEECKEPELVEVLAQAVVVPEEPDKRLVDRLVAVLGKHLADLVVQRNLVLPAVVDHQIADRLGLVHLVVQLAGMEGSVDSCRLS